MRLKTVLIFLAVCSPGFAEEGAHHQIGKLGTVRFQISCSPKVQAPFSRAVAMLHSFWYNEAEKAFSRIGDTNPKCGMTYWGVAMSNYHPVWAPPNPAELKRGAEAAEKAVAIGAKTARERAYIGAIAAFYRDSDRLDHQRRALIYEKAMEQLYRNYPDDSEAGIFYALALLGTAPATDKRYIKQKKAATILGRELPKNPDHPGLAHYIIHSYDYPQLAELALHAARRYAKIAPDSPHALHMPSHIFTRLGLWEDSIESNIASAASARKHVQRVKPGAGSFDQLHAMDYLAYAYLQQGQDLKAKQVVDEMLTIQTLDLENFVAAYAFAAIASRYALERRRWSEAAGLELHPPPFPWKSFRYAEAIVAFGRGLGAARTGNTAAARQEMEKLATIQRELVGASGYDWAAQVEGQRLTVAAWLAYAEGRAKEAIQLMGSAADLEDNTDKHPVTPGAVLPARELLGDMLLKLKRPAEALKEFETVLKQSPNRFNGLYGAARAAWFSGDQTKAKAYFAKLAALGAKADAVRPELEEARQHAGTSATSP